jgi:two-component system OmpR family response regulator
MTPLRVLYVDDDADIRTIVRMALSLDPAMTLTEAASGTEALALVAGGLVPDVAVVDVMMPGMTGPALMEALHARPVTAALPVIVMTAKARPADVAAYRARGATGVISKPFDPLTLAGEIRALVGAT